MILLAYDGSDGARAAVDHVARLMPGAPATVLTVPSAAGVGERRGMAEAAGAGAGGS